MDLKQLKTFIRVADTGSLSAASDSLRLAQPALSRQIRLLEESIGSPLFLRHGRGMQLTEAGQELHARVAGLVLQLEKSVDDVRLMESEPRGSVALGMMPTVSYVLSARIAVRVARELPGVALRIVEGFAGFLVEWVRRGEVDATFLYGPSSDLHLPVTELFFEELVLVGPASEKLESTNAVSVRDLTRFKLVLPSRPHGLRSVIERAAEKAKVQLSVQFEADSFRVLKDLVEAGLGYTILPRSAISREQESRIFSTTQLARPKIMRQVLLALPPGRAETRATRAVTSIVLDEIRQMIDDGSWQSVPSSILSAKQLPGRPKRRS